MNRRLRGWIAASVLVAVGAITALWLYSQQSRQASEAEFLLHHWDRPLAPQGKPPASFSALEASLDPRACGQCHVAQFQGWSQSLHSQTMTAGILWQLQLMPQDEANRCLDCHAPLAEQKAVLAQAHRWPAAPKTAPPDHVPKTLGHDGLVCAACHVRGHSRFGPEPTRASSTPSASKPHAGFVVSSAFESSEFCASCHQFPQDGPRTAGKLREDTLAQWKQSRFAAEGRNCQSCHMPDRQHRWPGIHSPEMVQSALATSIEVQRGGAVIARVTNVGAGHYFPTYMVPKVRIELWLIDALSGRSTRLAEETIGWMVDVSLQNESFDNRLAPGASHSLQAQLPASVPAGARLELRAEVAPREHYERSFQSSLSQSAKMDAVVLRQLQQALAEAEATRFSLLLRTLDLDSIVLGASVVDIPSSESR